MAFLAGWTYRKAITIQHTNVDSNLVDFPVYIKIDADGDIGGNVSDTTNGYDIRFTEDDGETLLKYEREYFNIDTGDCTAHYWVKVPSILAASGAIIYIYYNDGDGTIDGEDAANTWDANFMGVFHLSGSYDGSADEVVDSSGGGNHGVGTGFSSEADGLIHKCQLFDGTNDYLTIDRNDLDNAQDTTIEAWFDPDAGALGDQMRILARYYSTTCLGVGSSGDGKHYFRLIVDGDLHTIETIAMTDAWHHQVITYDGSRVKMYIDSSKEYDEADTGDIGSYTKKWEIGADGKSSATRRFDGLIDEVRFSDKARVEGWVKFEYHNLMEGDNELEWSGAESESKFTPKVMMIN